MPIPQMRDSALSALAGTMSPELPATMWRLVSGLLAPPPFPQRDCTVTPILHCSVTARSPLASRGSPDAAGGSCPSYFSQAGSSTRYFFFKQEQGTTWATPIQDGTTQCTGARHSGKKIGQHIVLTSLMP